MMKSFTTAALLLLSRGDLHRLSKGEVVVKPHFIPPELVTALREDALSLREEGAFSPSGLRDNYVHDGEGQDDVQSAIRSALRKHLTP